MLLAESWPNMVMPFLILTIVLRLPTPFPGGDCDDQSDWYAKASSVLHISPDDPPVSLYHGKLDLLVSREQAAEYYETLISYGVDAELYLHGGRGHTNMFLLGSDAEDKAIAFLNRTACEGELDTPRC